MYYSKGWKFMQTLFFADRWLSWIKRKLGTHEKNTVMSLLDLDEPTHRTAKQTIKYRYIVIDFVDVCEIKSKQQIRQFNHDQLKKCHL